MVRSLVAAAVEKLSDVSRAELERGPARLVLPLVGEPVSTEAPVDQGALLYALYWLVVTLASEAPLLLSVDDAHWADEASLRWLEYLGARIREIGIVLAGQPSDRRRSHPVTSVGRTRVGAGAATRAAQRRGMCTRTRWRSGA